MTGAPQVGFSATMRKIRSPTSLLKGFLPAEQRFRESQAQYNRKPMRCQRTTVSGVTSRSGFFHPTTAFVAKPRTPCRESQPTPRSLGMESQQLLTKREVLQNEVFSGLKKLR